MADFIRLASDPHDEAEKLLPWYVTGRLDPADRAKLEGHLAECWACQLQVRTERKLAEDIQNHSPEIDVAWLRLRNRLERTNSTQSRISAAAASFSRRLTRPAVAGLLAAQLAIIALVAVLAQPVGQPAQYRALGTAPVAASANVIVMFDPKTTESNLRGTLQASGAKIVDGPTSAGAYLLRVPVSERSAALAKLRASEEVAMAQPIDAAP